MLVIKNIYTFVAEIKEIYNMEKIKVSSDTLYNYLVEHDFTISLLAEYMGVNGGSLAACFRHNLDRLGRPRKFSAGHIKKLNNAIVRIAEDMRGHVLVFGGDKMFTNQQKSTYDPGLIEPIKRGVGKFFKLRGMTERVLGWNRTKCNFVLSTPSSKNYGNITREDADRINAELLAVAGVLSGYEVVADEKYAPKAESVEQSALPRIVQGVPAEETSYALADLYAAFGEEKRVAASRLQKALERKHVTTLAEFVSLSPGQLLDMEGVGVGTITLIYKALQKMGVRW